jgi:hypothetical protein
VATSAGGLAYVLGYLITGLVVDARVSRDFGRASEVFGQVGDLGVGAPSGLQVAGWFFYATQFVGVRLTGSIRGVGSVSTPVDVAASGAWTDALYLVPVVVLLLAGAAVVALTETERPVEGAILGGSVGLGYFPLAVLGVFLASWSVTGPFGVRLAASLPVTTAASAALAYSLAFGGLGGVLAHALLR